MNLWFIRAEVLLERDGTDHEYCKYGIREWLKSIIHYCSPHSITELLVYKGISFILNPLSRSLLI